MSTTELQLEGLVGPSHNYAGLSHGNVASTRNAKDISHPKEAALQSLEKMKFVHELGIPVAIMPPQPRPRFDVLARLGYQGNAQTMLQAAWAEAPDLVANIWSASSMWSANAATIAPSVDTGDGKVHFTPANLLSTLHRSIEARTTAEYLRQIFADDAYFTVHDPLPVTTRMADEGAANHMRLCDGDGANGHHIFVYGAAPDSTQLPARFPARQQLSASEAVARAHQLAAGDVTYLQQTPRAIDAGVFHNDVIALSHGRLLICHADAYVNQDAALQALQDALSLPDFCLRTVHQNELSLEDAVKTYFFNAQILPLSSGNYVILFPKECEEHKQAHALCQRIVEEDNPVEAVHFLNLRESMKNGGGPACLRLRVPLNEAELAAMHQGVLFTPDLHHTLTELVKARYPEAISPTDLQDFELAQAVLATQHAILDVLGLK